jgi:murein DD-endopeptidase MepM/ murein hydrolase activator NlpD
MRQKFKLFYIIYIIHSFCVFGQTKSDMLLLKSKLLSETKLLNNAINSNKDGHQKSIEELQLINKQIQVQSDLLSVSEKYIELLQTEQNIVELELQENKIKLMAEKNRYTKLILEAHRIELIYNPILLVFSSSSFNQFKRTMYHFRQLEIARRTKHKDIMSLQLLIKLKKKIILEKKVKQAEFSKQKTNDMKTLSTTKLKQKSIIQSLILKQDSLSLVLKQKDLQTKKINDEILAIIEKEKLKNNNYALTPEGSVISKNFSTNKGQLNWPVSNGIVTSKFGTVQHPVLPSITTINNGIEITTNNTYIKTVFSGRVSKILILPNGLKVVIIRHGEYLSVYSNLYEVNVIKNQNIETKDIIGKLYSDQEKNKNILGFQIWKGREKLNPSYWLSSN